ncbi:MAG: hydroxymethylbilane synthase [Paenibacillaceae bacterium]
MKQQKRHIIVGTRKSVLAVTQTNQIIQLLQDISLQHGFDYEFRAKNLVTQGDRILDVTLSKVGGKGLFVKEIEQALIEGEIDLAVHSLKDMPAELLDGLMIGAVPKRVDPRDCLITANNCKLADLPYGARIGTSSLRRICQLKAFRSDLQLESIRGNIDTRILKLKSEGFDAIMLASAGLFRMGWENRISEYLDPVLCLPAVGQGALGIECRTEDMQIRELLDLLNDPWSAHTVMAERSFLKTLNGGCQVPIGAYAEVELQSNHELGMIRLTGMVGSPDGDIILKETMTGIDPTELGVRLGELLISQGANRILDQVGS